MSEAKKARATLSTALPSPRSAIWSSERSERTLRLRLSATAGADRTQQRSVLVIGDLLE
jgi:hypothetical protein